jgi:endoglucanase
MILNTAIANDIPFQRLASRVTGTDTDAFLYSNGGALLGFDILCRWHTS